MENPLTLSALSLGAQDTRLGRSVSIDQAAELLGLSRRTIYYRISQGRLQTMRTLGGSQRVLVESLEQDFRSLTRQMHPATLARTLRNSSLRNA